MSKPIQFYVKNIVYNIPFLVSICGILALYMKSEQEAIIGIIIFSVFFFTSLYKRFGIKYLKDNVDIIAVVATVLLVILSGLSFYIAMIYSSKMRVISEWLGINNEVLVAACAVAGGLCGIYASLFITTYILEKIRFPSCDIPPLSREKRTFFNIEIAVCLISAIVVITICSKSSPLYPLNDWVDANCFFTVGKSMLSGIVPYRDLIEQKGPLLYMLHAVAALISYKTFFGVYVLEVAMAVAFLFICQRIIKIYYPDVSLVWIPVIAAIVYSTASFSYGDSAEELCLPLVTYSLYCGLKSLHLGKEISLREGFFIGVTSACVLWIKFSLLGVYIGWFVAYTIIRASEKNVKNIIRTLSIIVFGVVVLSSPIILYFLYNNALEDLFRVYFYNNLFFYTSSEGNALFSSFYNLFQGYLDVITFNIPAFIFVITGIFGMVKAAKRKQVLLILFSSVCLFIFVYIGGQHYKYYSMILSAFSPIGVIGLESWVSKIKGLDRLNRLPKLLKTTVLAVICMVFAYVNCESAYLLGVSRDKLPQYQFAEIILQNDDPTILNYGFLDGGFYTTTGIVPNCKCFCKLNISVPEYESIQKEYVDNGLVDFVITKNKKLSARHYRYVVQSSFYLEGEIQTYYLYQREY